MPNDWAQTQNGLGDALWELGRREQEDKPAKKYFEQAVTSYRAALLERTQEHSPEDWAQSQHNLGDALRDLAGREREDKLAKTYLAQAVAAYRAALLQRTQEKCVSGPNAE